MGYYEEEQEERRARIMEKAARVKRLVVRAVFPTGSVAHSSVCHWH